MRHLAGGLAARVPRWYGLEGFGRFLNHFGNSWNLKIAIPANATGAAGIDSR